MRKLSELYQVVLDSYKLKKYDGICLAIAKLTDTGFISEEEYFFMYDHFEYGKHKFPKDKRRSFWFKTREERIEYLKYLIKLCKEQDI